MGLFKKKCAYCNKKINKGDEILAEVKVPEFINKVTRAFCSPEHVELYKQYVKNIPKVNSCPYCRD
jgi:hypothetical protein